MAKIEHSDKEKEVLKLLEKYKKSSLADVATNAINNIYESNQLKKLEHEISQKPTIIEKLNYWLEIKDNFKNIYPNFIYNLEIPESIYKLFFEPLLNEPEFQFWLLKYYAQTYFENILLKDAKIILSNEKSEIQFQLNKIIDIENKANIERNLKIDFDYTRTRMVSDFLTEYFRIKNNYYSTKLPCREYIESISYGSIAVQVYAKHILLKNFLEAKLKELEQPSPVTVLLENGISAPKKQPKRPTAEKDNSLGDANHKVNVFENIFKVRKNIKDSLHEFESREFRGFSKRTLERAIKIKYNDSNLTFKSYVERYLTDNLSNKKKSINN